MDSLSSYLANQDHGVFTYFSVLLDDPLFALLITALAFLLVVKVKTPRASPLFLSLVVAFFSVPFLKGLFAVARPCPEFIAKIACPSSASFPSGHATVSGAFLLASVGTPLFLPFLTLAILVSISRVYLGIHYLADVAAGIALGFVLYAFSERLYYVYRKAIG